MPGRNASSGDYRYGFNGMEMDIEVNNITGSSYTAEFWQYDSRLGRRWNRDPVVYAWQSSYAAFNNNPIYYADPSGAEGEPVDQETANSGGGEVGDTYTDNGGSVFEKTDYGWIPRNDGNGGVPNPAPVDNTYAYIDKYMGGGKNYNYDKSLWDMLRDLENMMTGGLHMWGSGNYKTNFAPKVHDKNILEFDFNEFMSIVDEASSAIKRMDNLEGKKDYIEILKKLNEVREAVLENASAEEIQVKVEAYQDVIHKQDLPPLDYEIKVQFFGAQPNGVDSVYKNGVLYKLQYINGDTIINKWFSGNPPPFKSGWDFPKNSKKHYYNNN